MAEEVWLRRADEPAKPYQLFQYFLAFPLISRTNAAVSKKYKVPQRTIEHYSTLYDWQARAVAYDRHKARRAEEIEEEAMRAAADQEAKKWSDRRALFREQGYALGAKLFTRAEQMMTYPLFTTKEQVAADGKTIVHVHPARWSMASLISTIGMAVDITVLTTGLAGEADPMDDVDLTNLSRAEMQTIVDNKPLPKKRETKK